MKASSITAFLTLVLASGGALASGQLDSGYGSGGYAGYVVQTAEARYPVMDVAADGSLLAVGIEPPGCTVVAITASGQLDPGWADGGVLRFSCNTLMQPAVLRQPDGKVLVAYAQDDNPDARLVVMRLDHDATPDVTFASAGIAALSTGSRPTGAARLLLGGDGDIWVAATGLPPAASCSGEACTMPGVMTAAHLLPDGTALSIQSAHEWWLPNNQRSPELSGLIADDVSGAMAVIVSGFTSCAAPTCPVSYNGFTQVIFPGDTAAPEIKRLSWPDHGYDGPVIQVIGRHIYAARVDGADRWLLSRFVVNDGSLVAAADPGFGRGGTLDLTDASIWLGPLAIDGNNGRIYVAAGSSWAADSNVTLGSLAVTCFLPDGRLDRDFGQYGQARIDFGVPVALRTLQITQDGGVLLGADAPGQLATARIGLGDGTSPGRLGFLRRYTWTGTGSLVGNGGGYLTTINERETTLAIPVGRGGGVAGAVSARYRIAGNGQAAGTYLPATGVLEWPDDDTTNREVPLQLHSDPGTNEGAEIELILEDASGGASLGTTLYTVRVLDAFAGTLSIAPSGVAITEGDMLSVPVSRSGGNGAVSVVVAPVFGAGNGAASGADVNYVSSSTITWADGETGPKEYRLRIARDRLKEEDEQFDIVLRDPTGGATLDSSFVHVTIKNSDTYPPATGGGGGGGALGWFELALLTGLAGVAGVCGGHRAPRHELAFPAALVPAGTASSMSPTVVTAATTRPVDGLRSHECQPGNQSSSGKLQT